MLTVPVQNCEGEKVGEVNLSEAIFSRRYAPGAVYQAVVTYQANRRAGTASTKTRGEVSGGGKKPWRQKGTGRARAGSNASPLWRRGGAVFGPHPRSFRRRLSRTAKRRALASELGERLRNQKVLVVDKLVVSEGRTRVVKGLLEKLGVEGKVLLVLADHDGNLERGGANLPGLRVALAKDLNVLDILSCERAVLTRDALERLEERLTGK